MRRSLALDTNLLLLLVVGLASIDYIAIHKRLGGRSVDDYRRLDVAVGGADRLIVTPNTATETSNLSWFIGEPARSNIRVVLRYVLGKATEVVVPSASAATRSEFPWLGLADAVLLEVARGGDVVLTIDTRLCTVGRTLGYDVFHFVELH